MIQLLAPILSSALAPALAASSIPAVASLGTVLSKPLIGSALSSGIASLLSGDDIGDALKSAAIGGVGGALGLDKAGQGLGEAVKEKGLAEGLATLTGKEGLFSPGNLLLLSALAPKPKSEKPKPFIGGGYYGAGMRHIPARDVFNVAEGGRIVGPGTPTSDSIPAMIYQDGVPVQEAALSTQEVVLSHKDLAALDPNGDYEKVSEMIGNTKNGDRGKAAAELFMKMKRA